MWASIARAAVWTVAAVFLMWALRMVLDPILSVASSGPHANEPEVVRVGNYFEALTLDNLILIALLGIAAYLVVRAVVEKRRSF